MTGEDKFVTWQDASHAVKTVWSRLGNLSSDRRMMLNLMIVILLIAGALRFTGIDWDENQHLHPDERFLTMVEDRLRWPSSFKEYLDSSVNPLSPYNQGHDYYTYGLLPVVVTKFIGEIVGETGYDSIYLVGRALNGVLDLFSIVLIFIMGKRLYDARVGLLGALFLAFSVLNIQSAHYFTVDTWVTFFVTLALFYAIRVAQGEGWGSVLAMAVAFGLATASKISVLPFLLVMGLAYTLRIWRRWQAHRGGDSSRLIHLRKQWGRFNILLRVEPDDECEPVTDGERLFFEILRGTLSFLVALVVAALVFRVAQPHAFTGPGLFNFKLNPTWKDDMSHISKLTSGEITWPPSYQWTGRTPVLFMLKNMVFWGLGLPLGIAAWVSWAFIGWEMYKKEKLTHLLPWMWMTFIFLYHSTQHVKTMRYLLPIYPTAAMVAAYGLIKLWDGARAWRVHYGPERRRIRWAVGVLILVVVLGTAFWAVAFTSIYTRPVTRVAASRWMYRNLPRGASVSYEVWDDPLPLNIDGRLASSYFDQVKMDLYAEDTPEKREKLYDWIERADYIVLSSNRLYKSIPRLPMRYPMTTRYYEALFSGELGFERTATFTSRPKLFGIEIVDDNAEEAFTVYDHPKVIIFRKRADFSMVRVRRLFEEYSLDRIVRMKPTQVTSAPNALMLSEEEWAVQRAGGTWSTIFSRNSLSNKFPTVTWLLALFYVGFAAFPLAFVAFWRMRDRGYLLSKTVGLLVMSYLAWLLPSLKVLPYSRGLIAGVLLGVSALSAVVGWVQRRPLLDFVRRRWRLLIVGELLFLAFFFLFWLIRFLNPDLWHPVMGGEKPMDMAYLNAIIKSTHFPPYDPWFAGGYINYYYFGWVVAATLIKLTAIVPSVAYNLAIPTFFALMAMGSTSVVFNLIPAGEDEDGWFPRALGYGLVGALLVAVAGNLGELQLLWNGFKELGSRVSFESTIPGLVTLVQVVRGLWAWVAQGERLPFRSEWWYWNASRIMKHGEINEFPFFSFLYADLHAHLTAMPFAICALALASNFVVEPVRCLFGPADDEEEGDKSEGTHAEDVEGIPVETRAPFLPGVVRSVLHFLQGLSSCIHWPMIASLTLLALILGELWCNNSWDFPTYAGVSVVALAIGSYAEADRINKKVVAHFALRVACVLALSMLFFLPYHANYGLAYSSVDLWKGERTSIGSYLIIHGTFLFILASYLLVLLFDRRRRNGIVRAIRLFLQAWERRRRALHLYDLLVRCPKLGYELGWLGLVVLGIVLLIFFLKQAWILLLAAPILALALSVVLFTRVRAERRFQAALVGIGLLLTLAVEYIVLKGDIGRMNTVFKFSLQVWIMWGVVGGAALAYLIPRHWAWPSRVRSVWRKMLIFLLIGVSLYPLCGTYGKVRDRWNPDLPPGLDGMRFMTGAHYRDNNRDLALEYDYRAIRWMQEHIKGSPVIAEANTPLYRWGSRVSVYTGLPTIVGWDWHQKQQRAAVGSQVVDWRLEDLRLLYNTPDPVMAANILECYQVGYIYVGELEKAYYDTQGLAKFGRMVGSTLEVAYRQGPVTIYRVKGSGAGLVSSDPGGESLWNTAKRWFAKRWLPGVVRAEEPQKRPLGGLQAMVGEPSLMLDKPVDQLPVVDDRGWNGLAANRTIFALFSWWVVLQLLGLIALPLVGYAFSPLPDGGYYLSKGIGLLLVSYLVWLGTSLHVVANRPHVAWAALLSAGGCSFFLWWRHRRRLRRAWRRQRRLILVEEGLFSIAFLLFVGLRLLNPDLWQPWFGGEKMMEIAFLNAICKSAHMPPYDPYFADGYINYYYYGQFIVATLIKLTGVFPRVAFNLAVPTFFGLTVSHVFGVSYGLVALGEEGVEETGRAEDDAGTAGIAPRASPISSRGLWAGIGAVVLVAVMGNLSGILQVLEWLARAGGASFPEGHVAWADIPYIIPGLVHTIRQGIPLHFEYWYYGTRIIPHTINEFPFFTFLFADLHPHLMGIPFTILVVGLAASLLWSKRRPLGRSVVGGILTIIALGALGVINTWDLPAYAALLGCVLLYCGYIYGGWRGALAGGGAFSVLFLLSLIAYGPFYTHYRAQYVGLGIVSPGERTRLGPFMLIWGFYVFLTISMAFFWTGRAWPWSRLAALVQRHGLARVMHHLWTLRRAGTVAWSIYSLSVAALMAVGIFLVLSEVWLWALLVPLAGLTGLAVLCSGMDRAAFFRRLMALGAFCILWLVEVFYMKDFLASSEWRRMNTIFKFYIQAWVLLGLAVGGTLPILWDRLRGHLGAVWKGAFLLGLFASLVYTALAIPARVTQRFLDAQPPTGTLDGTSYMKTAVYSWPDEEDEIHLKYDRQAIAWLWENVRGTPVLAEAPLGYYREGGLRVCSYTGLPMIIGAHENEQRPWEQLGSRQEDAEAIFRSTDVERVQDLLDKYRVRYIYVGQLERNAYDAAGLAKFDVLVDQGAITRVFHNAGVDIYRVVEDRLSKRTGAPYSEIVVRSFGLCCRS
ncbi:MAG: DUF2298 domain-containing protein [Chloroflexota bacterium]|nr:DUF2298 domain-containing protein [Chloroflexota bacterium]